MISVAYRDIQIKIAGFLAEQITFVEFQDWVAEIAWDIDSFTPPDESRLIHDIELRIAEYDAGHLPRDNFVDELKEMAVGTLDIESDASETHTTEPSSSYGQELRAQSQSSYKEYEMEFSS